MTQKSARLIAINGVSGSGKSLVSRRLRDVHGFHRASSGELCREITNALFGHEKRSALNQVSQAIRSIDQHLWIKATLRTASGDRIVFDSVRYLDDAMYLRSRGYEVWKVFCPVDTCIRRLTDRGQEFEVSDFAHDSERQIPDSLCAVLIDNENCTIDELYNQVDSLLQ